ncbi:hypothetical protein [Nocardiopsis ganjiahuensis]|uniref:hypothetical protein n=1 Tax=Nocardiopsis ganjiahuensis TaxID=239984 RepID=UPI0012687D7E|nr:hypothetical protein [Nocardiopsis ganjiahuensis]
MSEGVEVFRGRGSLFLGVFLSFSLWFLFALAVIGEGFGLEGVLVISSVFALAFWFELKVVYWRNVSIEGGYLVTRGYLTRTAVPVSRIGRIWVSGGVLLIELEDGEMLNIPAFQGSVVSSILGSPSASRAAERINEHREYWTSRWSGGDGGRIDSLHLNLVSVPVIWVVSFFVYWALSGFTTDL